MGPEQEKLLKEEMEKKAKMSKIARIKCINQLNENRHGRKRIDTKEILYFIWKISFSR